MKFLSEITASIKIRVTALSTFSAVTGFIVAGGFSRFPLRIVIFGAALFILAAGSAALNQYQERQRDALMERTRHRPLPSGRLVPAAVLSVSLVFILSGLLLLLTIFGPVPAVLGLLTVTLYNGVYTYLKRVTAFAAVPGALVGALPPAIGWTAAGGAITSPTLIGLVFFFYIWQIPHFWLLLGIHSDDYAGAGFPTLTDIFSPAQLSRITFTWVLGTACAGLLFPLFGMFHHSISLVILGLMTLWLGLRALPLLKATVSSAPVLRGVFMNINIFALILMVILIIDHGVLTWI